MSPSFEYYNQDRQDLIALLPPNRHFTKVLDIDVAWKSGRTLLTSGGWVTGIELMAVVAQQARNHLSRCSLSIEADPSRRNLTSFWQRMYWNTY